MLPRREPPLRRRTRYGHHSPIWIARLPGVAQASDTYSRALARRRATSRGRDPWPAGSSGHRGAAGRSRQPGAPEGDPVAGGGRARRTPDCGIRRSAPWAYRRCRAATRSRTAVSSQIDSVRGSPSARRTRPRGRGTSRETAGPSKRLTIPRYPHRRWGLDLAGGPARSDEPRRAAADDQALRGPAAPLRSRRRGRWPCRILNAAPV